MKKIIFPIAISLSIFCQLPVSAQEAGKALTANSTDTAKALVLAQQMPKFNGNMNQWISDHLTYPSNGAQGTVFLSFIVEKDGSISNVKVLRSVDHSVDSAAAACVRSMPRWIPGKQEGKLVRVQFTLPIIFQMPEIAPSSVNPTTPPRVK